MGLQVASSGDCGIREFSLDDFPEDLARQIFETAVRDPDTPNWACSRVSRKIQAWVEPSLYRDITLYYNQSITLIHNTLISTIAWKSSKPPAFFDNVRSLCIIPAYLPLWGDIMDLLSACTSLRTLHIFNWLTEGQEEFLIGNHPAWNALRLRRLRIPALLFHPSHLNLDMKSHPMFAHITHLELPWVTHDVIDKDWSWASLSSLETLTHLCLVTAVLFFLLDNASAQLQAAVPHFPSSLIVCVFEIRTLGKRFSNAEQVVLNNGRLLDSRVVVAVDHEYYCEEVELQKECVRPWIKEETIWRKEDPWGRNWTEGVDAMWKQAEAKVAQRKSERALKSS
ncbi:hypothetical protein D9611_011358 [Ephemerocybe angulata]|uniref:Uncharacterized protein n=1 Tax=Ephemerocybe angulata TaxID=980116 RepID=A0A8H5F1K0_9AGAR|nr:hypothetical protein D9611_011358 [Tulosesus angulatus]